MSRREKLERMLEQEPEDVFLNFGLAMEFAKEGSVQKAIAQLDRVLELDAGYVAAYFHKGNALIGCERLEDARSVLTEGIAVAQNAKDAHTESELRELLGSIS